MPECHGYGHIGYRSGDEYRCTNDGCWITEHDAAINAVVAIADRLDRGVKSAVNDIPWGGSICDSAATTKQSHPQPNALGKDRSEPTAGS